MATQRRSDPGGIKTESADQQRTLASQGGPATGVGNATNRKVSSPVNEDLQTQAAAKSGSKREDIPGEGGLDEPTSESQSHSRGGGGARGSKH